MLKTLAEGVGAIRAEHAVLDDTGALSEEVLRQKLGLALAPDVVERFLAMMNGTAEFTATKAVQAPAQALKPEDFANESAIRQVRYDATRQEQKLTVRVFDPYRAGLEARHPATLFAELMQDAEAQAREFFDNQLKKQKLRLDDEAGFLDEGDFSKLFDPLKPLLNPSLTVARYMILRLFISIHYRWYPMYPGCLFCLFVYVEFFRICLQ